VHRAAAVIAVVLGAAIVGFDPNRWDAVVYVLPRGHGIHVHDLIGCALIAVGLVVLWRTPRPVGV
jgi:hypothetical protein